MTSGANFYAELKPFQDFNAAFTDEQAFHALPSDWFVFITDIKNSTRAIEEGRYRAVNTLGAGTVAVAQNVTGGDNFPYVFGGDGASLMIAPEYHEKVAAALAGLRVLAEQKFGLELRLGSIPVKDIMEEGFAIEVARHELEAGKSIAVIRGGGLAFAEKLLRRDLSYEVPHRPSKADLMGLSCRWNPVPSQRGVVISLIVEAVSAAPMATYQRVMALLDEATNGQLEAANPIQPGIMSYRTLRGCLRDEIRYHQTPWSFSFLSRAFEIFAAVLIFRHNIPPLIFNSRHYAQAMRQHADYRKFDDTLRLVLDCSQAQVDAIRQKLTVMQEAGEILFGMHESDRALMTCLVEDVSDGKHIHFVDGGGGGYALAARELKAQRLKRSLISTQD